MAKTRRLRIADPGIDALPRSLEDIIAVRIVRIAEVISRLATRTFEAQLGLRNTDLRLLNLLEGHDAVTVNEIARRAHVDKAWVSRSLRELEQSGLVIRRVKRGAGRLCRVSLSAKGCAMLEKVRPLAFSRERRLLDGIDEARFKGDLDRLMANAEAMLASSVT